MLPVELDLIELYQKEKVSNVLNPLSAKRHREGYISILEGTIKTEKDPESFSSRSMRFKADMLSKGWTPEDMPMFEELFNAVENTADKDAKQKGEECIERLKNKDITSRKDRTEALNDIISASESFGKNDNLKMYYHTNNALNRPLSAVEYPEDEELRQEQKADFSAYSTYQKKNKNEIERLGTMGYEHNMQFENEKNSIRRREEYVLPLLTQEELELHPKNAAQKAVGSEMSQRDAIKKVFGKDIYDDIDPLYKGTKEERTVKIHHSRGNAQLDKGEPVLELDFAGTGFAQPRREYIGLHGKIVYEKKASTEEKKRLDAQFGKRVMKVGDFDTSEHHLRVNTTERNGMTKKRYSFPGPSADAWKPWLDMGSYTISKNAAIGKEIATEFLTDLMEKWKKDPASRENKKDIHINITGHSRGGVAATETVAEINDWLSQQKGYEDFAKRVKFDLILRDPVPGPDVWSERRRQPDLRNIPNLNSTEIYTFATTWDYFGQLFNPQKTRGQDKIIIGMTPHSAGLEGIDKSQMTYADDGAAHQWGYLDAGNKQYYRGSGLSELPDGMYLTDEKRNLIRVTKYSQIDNVMNLVNQHSEILLDNDDRQQKLREVVKNWFVDHPQLIQYGSEKNYEKEQFEKAKNLDILAASKSKELSEIRTCIDKYTNSKGKEKETAEAELLNACHEYARNTYIGDVNKKDELNEEKITRNKELNAAVDLYCQLQAEKNLQKQLEIQKTAEDQKDAAEKNEPLIKEEKNMPKPKMDNNAPAKDPFAQLKEKYGIKSISPDAAKKNLENAKEICADFEKLDFENAPGELLDLKKAVKEYKEYSEEIANHGKQIGLDELGYLDSKSDNIIKCTEQFKEYAQKNPGVDPQTLETIENMTTSVKATVSDYVKLINSERRKKGVELTGDFMATFNKIADPDQYSTEKYKDADKRPKGTAGYSIHRSAVETLTIMSMLNDGYTVEQTLDPDLCIEEKHKRYEKSMQLMGNNTPENQKEVAETLYKGYKKATEKINELSREYDFSKADIRDKKYCMILKLAHHRFDAGQETQHCREEVLEVSKKDNPEYKRYDDFIPMMDSGILMGNIYERYGKLADKAAYAALDRRGPATDTAELLATKIYLKHYEDLMASGQKKAPDKDPFEWAGAEEVQKSFNCINNLVMDFTKRLKVLNKEPDLAQSMARGIATGELFTKNKLGGKETEIEFKLDFATQKLEVKNFPHSLMIKEMAEKEYMKTEAPVKYEVISHLDELAAKHDAQGFVDYTQKITSESMRTDLPPKEEEEAQIRMDAYGEFSTYLHKKGGKKDLSSEDKQFCLEVFDKINGIRNGIIMDIGLKIDAMENEIRNGNIPGTELLKDNPKISRAMAQEYVGVREGLPEKKKLDIIDHNLQTFQSGLESMTLTAEQMECNVDGMKYKANPYITNPTFKYLHKRNWKNNYELALERGDVDPDRLKLYSDEAVSLVAKAKNKYNIGIEAENGKLKVTSLPRDIQRIQSSTPEQLQQYRDDLLREKGLLQTVKGAVSNMSGWAQKMLNELNEAHPENENDSEQMKNLRYSLDLMKNNDSGTTFGTIINHMDIVMKAAEKLERTNTGLFGGDRSIDSICSNIQSFGQTKKAEITGLSTEGLIGSIDMAISQRKETLRRLDKYTELNGIELKKNDEISFTPATDQRLEAVGNLLEQAKKGVWGGSKEYDTAAKSFVEMAKAYKTFRELKENTADADRLKAIEAYHEASAKARLDMDKYLKHREAKGPLENNRDTKTQKRIDSVNAAISVLQDTNAFMDDRYTESARRMLAADNAVIKPQIEADRAKTIDDDKTRIVSFRNELDKKPGYLRYLIKGVHDAMDKLTEISSADNSIPLSEAEKEDAKKAMAAITLYTTYEHAKKNDKGFAIPLAEDRLQPMIDQFASQPAFEKVAGGIDTRDQLRRVMVNPDELRQKYTLAAVSEKQQQKKNSIVQEQYKDQPKKEMEINNNHLNKGLK